MTHKNGLPQYIIILGTRYKVSVCKLDRNELGRSSMKEQNIHIDSSMSEKDNIDATLMHEAIHQISDQLNLELSESQVCGIEVGIRCLLKDNDYFQVR